MQRILSFLYLDGCLILITSFIVSPAQLENNYFSDRKTKISLSFKLKQRFISFFVFGTLSSLKNGVIFHINDTCFEGTLVNHTYSFLNGGSL